MFNVPESTASYVAIGQTVELKVDSVKATTFIGEIKRTTGELDTRTRTLRVEAEVKDEEAQLRPGMYGTVTVKLPDTSATAQ